MNAPANNNIIPNNSKLPADTQVTLYNFILNELHNDYLNEVRTKKISDDVPEGMKVNVKIGYTPFGQAFIANNFGGPYDSPENKPHYHKEYELNLADF